MTTEKYISYSDQVKFFKKNLELSIELSQIYANRSLGARAYWRSILMIRYINIAVGINRLLPTEGLEATHFHSWDFGAIATLTRTFIEAFHAFYYIGVDDVSEEEWEFRIKVFSLHDYSRREEIFKLMGESLEEQKFAKQKIELLKDVKRSQKFKALSKEIQVKIEKFQTAYVIGKHEIERKINPDNALFAFMYKFLSIQTHNLPMSFFRTQAESRGSGIENEIDKEYINMSVQWVSEYLKKGNGYMESEVVKLIQT